jgi:dihydroorotase
MAHNVATCFQIDRRGFIREGYWADLVLADLNNPWNVNKANILYKCGWSPFEGTTFRSRIAYTLVSGNVVYANGTLAEGETGKRLNFNR